LHLSLLGSNTTGELFFTVPRNHTSKTKIVSAKALPCGRARQSLLGNDPPGKTTFALHRAKIARQRVTMAHGKEARTAVRLFPVVEVTDLILELHNGTVKNVFLIFLSDSYRHPAIH
jgi:hypothetical protein